MEYASSGITFQTICPMMVATKMSKVQIYRYPNVRKTSFFTPSAESFASSAVRSIGLANETSGYLSHQIQVEVMNFIPSAIINTLLTKFSAATRQAALRKKAKSQ
ncbi:hypothetical protein ANCDUO_19788 [Ancylostoma duodenale]|uniref:Uncharacterized protein n=1 Tax=Ancylostoma duodenale TaxID=51022 RepID=A0A0C2CK28_9BILA|nr:hypothetical protein ANCDUO_19788 [Ancylostoma duodenale]